jgi:hypothetical protein
MANFYIASFPCIGVVVVHPPVGLPHHPDVGVVLFTVGDDGTD